MQTAVEALSRDERRAAKTLGTKEARWIVDMYYQMQDTRIAVGNQLSALEKGSEPNLTHSWLHTQVQTLENQLKSSLKSYALAHQVGVWAMSNKGVGPVITAGFLSRLELRPTVGAWWRFCGLDPTVTWGKGQKRPWNAELKRICWLLGTSFTKFHRHEDCFYGQIYAQRKAYEERQNEAGAYAEQAEGQLTRKNYGDDTKAKAYLTEGKLPPAQINLRAQRYAVKLFLSHMHHVWHVVETGEEPRRPYVLDHVGGHYDYIPPPNF